ncbi:MAG: creatininase family protein [Pseudomonadota bacterium]
MTRTELARASADGALVLIPTGSTEQHADHLPVETDIVLSAAIAEMAAARIADDVPVVVAPAVPFGFAPHHLSWPGTISLRLATYTALLGDVARSVLDVGFPRAIFVNGHGGNSAPLRALTGELITDGYAVGMVDYFAPAAADYAKMLAGALRRTGHACEQETALMMSLTDNETRARITKAITNLPARTMQPWVAPGHGTDPITEAGAGWAAIFQADDCGYFGDPAASTHENGHALLAITVSRLADFLRSYAETPLRLGVASKADQPRIAPPIKRKTR